MEEDWKVARLFYIYTLLKIYLGEVEIKIEIYFIYVTFFYSCIGWLDL